MTRPSPVLVDDADDAPIRHDINSEDIRRTYPDLPHGADRNVFVSVCDYRAYTTICHDFPDFRPERTRLLTQRQLHYYIPTNCDVNGGERGKSNVGS